MICFPSQSRKNDCHTDEAVTSIQNHRNQKTHLGNESKRTLASHWLHKADRRYEFTRPILLHQQHHHLLHGSASRRLKASRC